MNSLLRLCIVLSCAALAAAWSPPPARADVLGSTVWDWKDMAATPTLTGTTRNVVSAPTPTLRLLHVHVSTVNQVPRVPPHHHPTMTVVRHGSVRYWSGGKTYDADAGDFFFLAADALHTPYNVHPEPVVYYAIEVLTETTPAKPGPPADDWAGPDKLHTGVFPLGRGTSRPTSFGSETILVSAPTVSLVRLECLALTVNPGADTGERHEKQDALIFFPNGGLELEIKGVNHRHLTPGSFAFKASQDGYRIRNAGRSAASFDLVRFTTALTPP